jgi:excisionase family DNA binding protein
MKRYLYQAILKKNEQGGYDAFIPEFDMITQGDNLEDAAFMAQDVLALHISGLLKSGVDVKQVGSLGYPCPNDSLSLAIVTLAEVDDLLDETMTVAEAAETLDVSRTRIYALIDEGIIGSRKEGNMRLVSAEDVISLFNAPRRKAGRPRKRALV